MDFFHRSCDLYRKGCGKRLIVILVTLWHRNTLGPLDAENNYYKESQPKEEGLIGFAEFLAWPVADVSSQQSSQRRSALSEAIINHQKNRMFSSEHDQSCGSARSPYT